MAYSHSAWKSERHAITKSVLGKMERGELKLPSPGPKKPGPSLQLMEMARLHNGALDVIRLGYSQVIAQALCATVQHRLIEEKVGEDGAPVRSGGFRTGGMWRGFKVVPTTRGAKGFFGGSSISSWFFERGTKRGFSEKEMLSNIKAIRKKRAEELSRMTGKKVLPSSLKRSLKVQNRFKAAHVQWGAADPNFRNSDFKARSFLGFTEGEALAALRFLQNYIEKTSLPDAKDLSTRLSEAFRHSGKLVSEIKRRAKR